MKMLTGPSLSLMNAYGTGDFYLRQMEKKGSVAGALASLALQQSMAAHSRASQVAAGEAEQMNEMLLEEERRHQERMQAGFSGRMGMLSPDGDIAAGMRVQRLMARAQQDAFEHAAKESAVQTGMKMAHLVKEALLPFGAVKSLLPGATKAIAKAAPKAIASAAPAVERAGARAAVSGVRGALSEPGLAGTAARATKVRAERVLSGPTGLAHAPSPQAIQQGAASAAHVAPVKPSLGVKPPGASDPFEGVRIPAETPAAGADATPGLAPASAARSVRTPVPAGTVKGKNLRPFSSPAKAAPDAAHPGLAKAPESPAPAAEAAPATQRSATPASAPAAPPAQPSATPGLASPAPAATPPVAGMEPGQVLPNGLIMPAPVAATGAPAAASTAHLGLASPTVTQPGGGMAGLNFHVQGPSGTPGLPSPAALQTSQVAREQMAGLASPASVNKAVGEGPLPGMAPTAMKPQQAVQTTHGAVPVEQAMQNAVDEGKTTKFKQGLKQEAKTQRWEDQMMARADKGQHPGLAGPEGAPAAGQQPAGTPGLASPQEAAGTAAAPAAEAASKPWNPFSAGNIAKGVGLAGLGLGAYGAYKGLGAGQDYMMQPTYASNTYGGTGALPYGPQY